MFINTHTYTHKRVRLPLALAGIYKPSSAGVFMILPSYGHLRFSEVVTASQGANVCQLPECAPALTVTLPYGFHGARLQ